MTPALEYTIAFVGAFMAGGINALAGNGSVITLTILTELLGMPGVAANGTNRVGVLFNGLGGSLGFVRGGKMKLKGAWPTIIPVLVGALVGAWIAVIVSNEQFRQVFRFLMVFMLIVLLARPQRWLLDEKQASRMAPFIAFPLLVVLGFYGGFIQMGMGVFYLAILVLGMRYPLIEANAIKIVAVTLYTAAILLIFQYKGLIDWKIGLLMASGQFLGGWLAAQYASRSEKANVWAFRVLVFVVLISLVSLFDLI